MKCKLNVLASLTCLLYLTTSPVAVAQENVATGKAPTTQPAPNACRSVHLWYTAPEGKAFYNEVTVDRSAPGTYFMACGFTGGYFGMQEQAGGKKVVIFSVWDPGSQNDQRTVKDEDRVKLVYKDEQVRTGRFGGEGTGGQSFLDYDWSVGETCRFFVTAKPDGKRTEFAGYFYIPKEKQWKHLVTFSAPAGTGTLKGYYSFIEDFRRNRVSATLVRSAHFGGGWVEDKDGKWAPLTRVRFTGDNTPSDNINATVDADRFTLATGGDTVHTGVALRGNLDRPKPTIPMPTDLPSNSNK